MEDFASYSKPAQGQSPKTHQHPVLCREVRTDAWATHLPKGHGASQRLRGTNTHPQTLLTRRSPKVSTSLFLIPHLLVNYLGVEKSSSTSNLCPSNCSHWETLGATQEQRCWWQQSVELRGLAGVKDGEIGGPRRKRQLPALSTPGATCARWGGVGESRGCGVAGFCSAVYQLGGKAGGGAREPPHCNLAPSQLACWVTSQAQLIKLWANAVQERSGIQNLLKPHPAAIPPRSPFPYAALLGATQLGALLPPASKCSISPPLPSHCSSAHTLLQACPQPPADQEGVEASGNSREEQ